MAIPELHDLPKSRVRADISSAVVKCLVLREFLFVPADFALTAHAHVKVSSMDGRSLFRMVVV